MDISRLRTHWAIALATAAALWTAGCGAELADEADDGLDTTSDAVQAGGPNLRIGYSGWGNLGVFGNPRYEDIWTRSDGRANARICHAYPRYDIAEAPGVDASRDAARAHFQQWHDLAVAHGCEISVALKSVNQHHATGSPKIVPTGEQYERGFRAFRAAWPDVHVFSTWNEPNNDEGAETSLSPETAAEFYLRARRNCTPAEHCAVAAGDLASWHDWMGGVALQCGSTNPDQLCADGSYLDQFKFHIDRLSERYGLGAHFRPEYFGFHPWHDAFAYTEHGSHCGSAHDCMTRALLASLGGSWRRAHLWATEVAVENRGVAGRAPDFGQACAGAFVMRLFAISPRITRLYYFDTGGLIDGGSPDTIRVLRDRVEHFSPACW